MSDERPDDVGEEGHGPRLVDVEEAYIAELLLKERLAEEARMLNEGGHNDDE
jgi:hypothetical protein